MERHRVGWNRDSNPNGLIGGFHHDDDGDDDDRYKNHEWKRNLNLCSTKNLSLPTSSSSSTSSSVSSSSSSTVHHSSSSSSSSSSILFNPVVLCILVTETAERMAFFGFRAILVLYFTDALHFSESVAVALFQFNNSMAYLSPMIGAVLADGTWGRYHTILRFGWMYAIGLCCLTMGAMIARQQDEGEQASPQDAAQQQQSLERFLTFFGLALASIGTGGIKPCVSAFGADQVCVEEQNKSYSNRKQQQQQQSIKKDPLVSLPKQQQHHDGLEETNAIVEQDEERIREYFSSFYICINIGALTSFATIPLIRATWGFDAAFLVPTISMMFALLLFWSQRHKYKHEQRRGQEQEQSGRTTMSQKQQQCHNDDNEEYSLGQLVGALCAIATQRVCQYRWIRWLRSVLWFQRIHPTHNLVPTNMPDDMEGRHCDIVSSNSFVHCRHQPIPLYASNDNSRARQSSTNQHHQKQYEEVDDDEKQEQHQIQEQQQQQERVHLDAAQVLHLLPLLFFYPIFWLCYDQQGSVWTLQATRMALHGLEPEQLNIVNPFLIMALVPFFDRILYPWAQTQMGWSVAPLKRMKLGMVLAALSMCMVGMVEQQIQHYSSPKIHVAWQLPQITIMAIAEVLLNVTGLEFVYAQSPPKTKALILALYYVMSSVGDGLGSILFATIFRTMNVVAVMYLSSFFMMMNWACFLWFTHRWKPYHQYQQQKQQQQQQQQQLLLLLRQEQEQQRLANSSSEDSTEKSPSNGSSGVVELSSIQT